MVGAAIATLAAYIALLYAGYASRNWAKADTIAVANGWLDLLPDSKEPLANDATRLTRRAWRYGRGVDHTRDIPPVFRAFFFTAVAVLLVNFALFLWAVIALFPLTR